VFNHVFLFGNSSADRGITYILRAMGKINQNQIRTNKSGDSETRRSFLDWLTRGNRKAAGAAVLAVIVLHFASQFAFFRSEEPLPTTETVNIQIPEIKPENDLNIEAETEYQTSAPTVKISKSVKSTIRPESKTASTRAVIKKREPRESRTARLRRAEKILTGV
jgi:hypothetical protein